MSATHLFDRGYTELVSVIPPGAPLAKKSRIKPEMRGKVPGKRSRGVWVGYFFTQDLPDRREVEKWEEWGSNIGLLGNHFPALDIDVEDETLAQVVIQTAFEVLGQAPIRRSRGSRRLLVYRSDDELSRVAGSIPYGGHTHLVEFLGRGRQYLVHGTHPSGTEYRWEDTPLWEINPEDLNTVTAEKIEAFYEELTKKLNGVGVEMNLIGQARAKGDAPPQEDLMAPSIDDLLRIVGLIPNPEDWGWDEMVQMGYAIKAAGQEDPEEAKQIFLDWCERWEGGVNDPDLDAYNWDSFHGPFRIGWEWLQRKAQEAGNYLIAQDEFEADPEATILEAHLQPNQGFIPHTDEWTVHQILPQVKDQLRYVPSNREWMLREGNLWSRDESLKHELFLREKLTALASILVAQADDAPGNQGQKVRTAAQRMQSATGIDSVARLLRAKVATSLNEFDRDPMLLNTPEGAVDLLTGEPSTLKGQLFARSTKLAPAPGPHPAWDQFLNDLTGKDPELIRYLQKVVGYSLTGDVAEKTLWFIWGSDSDTGKSTFIKVVTDLMGSYADHVDVGVFINQRGARVEALARLPGVRLVTATEPAAGHAWDEHRIKAITGGDPIEARALYGMPFVYQPQYKIMIVGNHEPEIRTVDDAMLRRIHIVPFNVKVPREKQVENLARKLVEREGPQILQWMIAGCHAYFREKLQIPEAVAHKTAEYEETEDTFSEWIQEACELGEDKEISSQALYRSWATWCRTRGEDPGGQKTLTRRLKARRDLKLRNTSIGTRRLRGFSGIALRSPREEEDFDT